MGNVLKINIGRMSIDADLLDATFIMSEPIIEGKDLNDLNINISESTKIHPCFSYTTNLETARLIFSKMTFRSSNLSYANLNDSMEKELALVSLQGTGSLHVFAIRIRRVFHFGQITVRIHEKRN